MATLGVIFISLSEVDDNPLWAQEQNHLGMCLPGVGDVSCDSGPSLLKDPQTNTSSVRGVLAPDEIELTKIRQTYFKLFCDLEMPTSESHPFLK